MHEIEPIFKHGTWHMATEGQLAYDFHWDVCLQTGAMGWVMQGYAEFFDARRCDPGQDLDDMGRTPLVRFSQQLTHDVVEHGLFGWDGSPEQEMGATGVRAHREGDDMPLSVVSFFGQHVTGYGEAADVYWPSGWRQTPAIDGLLRRIWTEHGYNGLGHMLQARGIVFNGERHRLAVTGTIYRYLMAGEITARDFEVAHSEGAVKRLFDDIMDNMTGLGHDWWQDVSIPGMGIRVSLDLNTCKSEVQAFAVQP